MSVKLVEIRAAQMDEDSKEHSYALLDELRELIETDQIATWCYCATSATTVYNGGAALDADTYRLMGVLEQTKWALVYNYMMEDEDE